jgi:hypothetical protein
VKNRGSWVVDEEKYDAWVKMMDEMESMDKETEAVVQEWMECRVKLQKIIMASTTYEPGKWINYLPADVIHPNPNPIQTYTIAGGPTATESVARNPKPSIGEEKTKPSEV